MKTMDYCNLTENVPQSLFVFVPFPYNAIDTHIAHFEFCCGEKKMKPSVRIFNSIDYIALIFLLVFQHQTTSQCNKQNFLLEQP